MPKVHYVAKARKHNKRYGIKKGQPYWWWKRRAPGQVAGWKVVSLSPPRPSQLAGSPFMQQVLSLQEGLGCSAESAREAAEALRELAEEQ